jgi:phosphate transport system substrate-binding protein
MLKKSSTIISSKNLVKIALLISAILLPIKTSLAAKNRDYITMVGSSTVYPFATIIAEQFGKDFKFKTPTVESIGTGGGFKLFCSGIGYEYPDFADASRKIEASEVKKCNQNGIKNIVEIKIGYDGIVLANANDGQKYNLSKEDLFLALAEKVPHNGVLIANPYQKWNEINPKLPNSKIVVYGMPPTSGTRDSFIEMVMNESCDHQKEFIAAYKDPSQRSKKCKIIRSDAKFIEVGENPNLIIQKLKNDPNALGIFGFSYLEQNKNSIKAAIINGVSPSFKTIANNSYKLSRPLFIYAKKEHIDLVPGMKEMIMKIISKENIGNSGYLLEKGLVPLTDNEVTKIRKEVLKAAF